jgi:poly-gamma-glutamate capsule biosynthesis protein CapA/YwtB (metallophosphatase superfamily)
VVKVATPRPPTAARSPVPARRVTRRTRTRLRRLALVFGLVGALSLGVVAAGTIAKPVPNPAAGAPEISLLGKGDSFSLVWLGDTMLGDVAQAQLDLYGPAWAAARVPPPADADVVIANLEGPITNRVERFDLLQQFSYQQSPSVVKAFAELGIDVFTLANNHTMDRGPLGLADTIANARAAGLRTFGAGATTAQARLPLLVKTDIGVLGVVALSDDGGAKVARRDRAGIRRLNQANIVEDLQLARRAGADWVAAYVQWGENYSPVDERQRAFARALVAAGYDLVIGGHPHVVQPIEIISGVPVVYSLGNYVFTTRGRFNDAVPGFGLMLSTQFRPGRIAVTMRCIQTDNEIVLFQPRPCDTTQAQLVLGALHPQVRVQGDVGRLEVPLRPPRGD